MAPIRNRSVKLVQYTVMYILLPSLFLINLLSIVLQNYLRLCCWNINQLTWIRVTEEGQFSGLRFLFFGRGNNVLQLKSHSATGNCLIRLHWLKDRARWQVSGKGWNIKALKYRYWTSTIFIDQIQNVLLTKEAFGLC